MIGSSHRLFQEEKDTPLESIIVDLQKFLEEFFSSYKDKFTALLKAKSEQSQNQLILHEANGKKAICKKYAKLRKIIDSSIEEILLTNGCKKMFFKKKPHSYYLLSADTKETNQAKELHAQLSIFHTALDRFLRQMRPACFSLLFQENLHEKEYKKIVEACQNFLEYLKKLNKVDSKIKFNIC